MGGDRQSDAVSGNELPEDDVSPAFAWFTLPISPPEPRPLSFTVTISRAQPALLATNVLPIAAPVVKAAPVVAAVAEKPAIPLTHADPQAAPTPRPVLPTPAALAVETAPATPATAGQVFAAAIEAARPADDRPVRAPEPVQAAPTAQPTAVASTPDTQQAPLDLRQERWPQAMIERIEALRDSADARDTRIRLVPDALGAIDVSLRREGSQVHVHLAAAEAPTRQILADAQPRLAELADARGLKLGGSSVDAGAGQQQRSPAPAPLPRAPRRASRAYVEPITDHRIA